MPRPSQHVAQRLLGAGDASRDSDLGTVQHDVVGQLQRRPDEAQRDGGVEYDQVCADFAGELVDAPDHPGVRQQHRLAGPLDPVGLGAVEPRRAGVRARQHGEAIRWEPPPPLPQQRLDPADLRWEVVRDEEVLHGPLGPADVVSPSRALAHVACSARIGSS